MLFSDVGFATPEFMERGRQEEKDSFQIVTRDPCIQLRSRVIHNADHIKDESWLKELNFSKGVLQKLM